MSEIKDGGPAFPTDGESQVAAHLWHFTGLTKREWYAGMALQGLLANPSTILKQADIPELAFEYADATIKAGKGEK